jgi:hypothetical protein
VAKKAKAKKAKAAISRARTARARELSVTPTYLPEGQTYTMGLQDVVRVVKIIEKYGHMTKFVRAAKRQQAAGTFDAKTVNFVKDFMVKQRMYSDPIGKHIVNARQARPEAAAARGTGRFNCNF